MQRLSFLGVINSLEAAVRKLKWRPKGTEWADYYHDTNYSRDAFEHKKQIVGEFLDIIHPESAWDLGANIGVFSRIAAAKGIQTLSFDGDPSAVEENYQACIRNDEAYMLPLLLDLANPSPGIGWQNQERMTLIDRGPADVVLALALIHHLVISNNLPFAMVADFLSRICRFLIIEYVPKTDSQVARLLATREDIFPDYTAQAFEGEFSRYFTIQKVVPVRDSERVLYLMEKTGVET
jgi:ribosomal protein L11 methylase PrmA